MVLNSRVMSSSLRVAGNRPMHSAIFLATMQAFLVLLVSAAFASTAAGRLATTQRDAVTRSGLRAWVDPDTPISHRMYESASYQRSGASKRWSLVMSDEFNVPGRSFQPGEDHVWTSLEKPDGVNAALEFYSHNMTTTKCDARGECFLAVRVEEANASVSIWNGYTDPPQMQRIVFYYQSAMLQSWNKLCVQGGMVEVRAQLPGAVSPKVKNPDIVGSNGDLHAPVHALAYYPTWPGIWMLGNLGRAIFSASTHRMWPFSYSRCAPDVFPPSNQRISACDGNPGHGLNAFQGRGAPEIDILEGGGTDVSASIQIAPGMPRKFRVIPPNPDMEVDRRIDCIYRGNCVTPGANAPDLPERLYAKHRSYRSWYQGIRYAANNQCWRNATKAQMYAPVKATLVSGEHSDNECLVGTCPASQDPNCDLSLLDPTVSSDNDRWGINANGTCFAVRNAYDGSFICSPGNQLPACVKQRNTDQVSSTKDDENDAFAYQMDAISANWGLHIAAYTSYLVYQMEWVNDEDTGYVKWMLDGAPLLEIPAASVTNPPQDANASNPRKHMIQEPLYLIVNVAVSSYWGAQPPNPRKPCHGDWQDPVANAICDDLPLYLKIDYVRVYQDTSEGSPMAVGCDPASHPTQQWIADHVDEYEDDDNKVVDVIGRAFCRDDDDCTVPYSGNGTVIQTGRCVGGRCACLGPFWVGPRCIQPVIVAGVFPTTVKGSKASSLAGGLGGIAGRFLHGPPRSIAIVVGVMFLVLMLMSGIALQVSMWRERQMNRSSADDYTGIKGFSPGTSTRFRVPSSTSPSLSPLVLRRASIKRDKMRGQTMVLPNDTWHALAVSHRRRKERKAAMEQLRRSESL